MHAAYWHKKGIDIYRLKGNTVEKVASGAVEGMKPVNPFGKRVLIVGRDMLVHVRKRYPAISEKDIEKAIGMEMDELFPIPNPSFCFRVFEKTKMYLLVDIWAWDGYEAEKIKRIFGFTHVIPEDLALVTDGAEIVAYGFREMLHLTAFSHGRFLGSSSFAGSAGGDDLELFMRSLGSHKENLIRLRLCGNSVSGLRIPGMESIREEKDYPPCLDNIRNLNLRESRVRESRTPPFGIETLLRMAVYLMIGYALSLFLSLSSYEDSLKVIHKKLEGLPKKTGISAPVAADADYSAVSSELKERLGKTVSPLNVMEAFASALPENSIVTRMVVNEKKVEASMTSKEPLDVIKALSLAKGVKDVRLRGAPMKDMQTGNYNFALEVEM